MLLPRFSDWDTRKIRGPVRALFTRKKTSKITKMPLAAVILIRSVMFSTPLLKSLLRC